MLDLHEMRTLVEACTYKPGWIITFNAGDKLGNLQGYTKPYIQVEITEETEASLDSVARDGSRMPWKSGKRYLTQHMCRQEVVGAVFGLIKDAEMHEIHEWFRYKDASIFNPHLDPDALATLAKRKHNFNVRDNPMSMQEI